MVSSTTRGNIRSLLQPIGHLTPRREVLAILLILAETMIVYLFAGTVLAGYDAPYAPPSVALIFTVLLVGRTIPHLLTTIRIWSPHYEIVMAGSLLLTMLAVIKLGAFPNAPLFSLAWLQGGLDSLILRESDAARSVWMLIVLVAFTWWRGRTRAEPSLETAYTMLRFGVIWLVAGLVFTVLIMPATAQIYEHLNAALLGFVVITLLAIAIARQPEQNKTAAWNTGWVWLLIFVLPILAIAATAISTVGIFTRDTLELFLTILSPLLWLIQVSLQALILTIAVIAFIIVSPIIWFLERQGFRPLSNFPMIDLSPASRSDAEQLARSTLQIENPVRYLIAGTILLILIWLLARYTFRRRRYWEEDPRLQRESLIEWNPTPGTLLQRVRRWMLARVQSAHASSGPFGPEWEATRLIRRVYQQFLRANRRDAMARELGETPTQFARRVTNRHPGLNREIDRITGHYNSARYSGRPASRTDADQAEQAWEIYRERSDES